MQTTAKDVLKSIPDFEDFMSLSKNISELMHRKLKLEAEIKTMESDVFKTALTDEKYFQNGKPPTATQIENTYKFSGIVGEILPLRHELASVISSLEEKKIQFEVYKAMIDVWRTLSSTERSSSL